VSSNLLAAGERGIRSQPALDAGPGHGARVAGQIWRFGAVGLCTTLVNFGLFWALKTVTSAVVANLLALLLTTLANTAANRRLTFGVRGRNRWAHAHAGGLLAFGLSLTLTTGSISALQMAVPRAGVLLELGVLGLANAVTTVARFLLLRAALYHPLRRSAEPTVSRRNAA
jgi:putative flippase GtrA